MMGLTRIWSRSVCGIGNGSVCSPPAPPPYLISARGARNFLAVDLGEGLRHLRRALLSLETRGAALCQSSRKEEVVFELLRSVMMARDQRASGSVGVASVCPPWRSSLIRISYELSANSFLLCIVEFSPIFHCYCFGSTMGPSAAVCEACVLCCMCSRIVSMEIHERCRFTGRRQRGNLEQTSNMMKCKQPGLRAPFLGASDAGLKRDRLEIGFQLCGR